MVSFGGFSAIPEGFETGLQGREKELDLQGTQAFGRALQLMFSGGQGGQAPIPPPPGQASVPGGGAPGQQPGMQPLPWSQGGPGPPGGPGPAAPGGSPIPVVRPSMPGGPQPNATPPPAPPPQPPMGGGRPPGAFAGSPMQLMPPGGPQQGQPALDLQSVIGAIVKSNPGANPAVIASAVNRFIPLMNQQSQQQWREMTLMMREQAIMQAEYFKSIAAGQKQEGLEETARHHGETEAQTQERLAKEQQRIDEAYRHHGATEKTAEERAATAAAEAKRKKEQGDVRADQAQQRLDIAKQDLQRKIAADAERKKQGEGKLAIAQKQYDLAVQRNDLAGQRAALQAMHFRMQEIITAWGNSIKLIDPTGNMVKELLQKNREYYRNLIDNLEKPEQPKTDSRAPAGTPIPGQQPAIPQ